LPPSAEEDLVECLNSVHRALESRGRQYYIFGGICCKLLSKVQRSTVDIDVVIENGSLEIPNPRDWLEYEPFFWSAQEQQYVFILLRDAYLDGSQPDIICQGRCFVEADVNVAGWGSFPTFEQMRGQLVPLPGTRALSLPRNELLKLKMAGWGEKSRREGPKRANDYVDVIALRQKMVSVGEKMLVSSLNDTERQGLRAWIGEFQDMEEWKKIEAIL